MNLVYLIFSLVILPIGYVRLCRWMRRSVANPPCRQFFFLFGIVGGYLLLRAIGPSFFTLMLFLPGLLAAFIAVAWSIVTSLRAKPRSKFHIASSMLSVVLIHLMIWCVVSPGLGGFSYAGRWVDDKRNWSRAMGGQPQPPDVKILHSQYARSPHFTYEASYFFEFTAPPAFLEEWIAYQRLVPTPATEANSPRISDTPGWFTPKPFAEYEMWMPPDNSYNSFRIYKDRSSGVLYVCDNH